MFGRNDMVGNLVRGGIFGIAVAAAVPIAMQPAEARADDYVRGLKAHTAAVLGAVETAVSKLDDAKDALKNAKDLLQAARGRLLAAGAAATEGLRQAVIRAAAVVAAAEGAIVVAAKAVAVATAAAAAFTAGTLAGQGLGWVVSWCWDPYCPVDCDCELYPFPFDAQLAVWMPDLLLNATGVEITRADFDEADEVMPGVGKASWAYMEQMMRTLAIGSLGLAAHTNGDHDEVQILRAQLEAALAQNSVLAVEFAQRLAELETWSGTAREDMAAALEALDEIEPLAPQFPDPQEVLEAIELMREAVEQAGLALDSISDGDGNPRPLDGPEGFIDPLTLERYFEFLDDCGVRGVDALPEAEWRMIDELWRHMELDLRGQPSVGPAIAAWDARGDTGNEAADFGPNGLLTATELLHTLTPTFYSWTNMMLARSPVVIDSWGPWSTHAEQPGYVGSPNGQNLSGRDGWYVPPVPGSQDHRVYTYGGNTLGVPMDPLGGFDQFIGGRGVGFNQVLRSQKDIQFSPHYTSLWYDVYFGPPDQVPAPPVLGRFSLEPFEGTAGFAMQAAWNNPNAPTGVNVTYVVFDAAGNMTPVNGIIPAPPWQNLPFGKWYRFSTSVDFATNRVHEVSITDLETLDYTVFRPSDVLWYLRGGAAGGSPLPGAIRLTTGSPNAPGNTLAWDNLAVAAESVGHGRVDLRGVRSQILDLPNPAFALTAVVGGDRPFTAQWFRNGEPVEGDCRVRGVTTPALHIEPALGSDSGYYTFRVTNDVGSVESEPLLVVVGCRADYNGDGQVDFFDYLDFVMDYNDENPRADFNFDGQVDFFDYLDFVLAYDAACE